MLLKLSQVSTDFASRHYKAIHMLPSYSIQKVPIQRFNSWLRVGKTVLKCYIHFVTNEIDLCEHYTCSFCKEEKIVLKMIYIVKEIAENKESIISCIASLLGFGPLLCECNMRRQTKFILYSPQLFYMFKKY